MSRGSTAPQDVCAALTNATAVPLKAGADAITFQSNRRSFVKRPEKIFGLKLAYSQRHQQKRRLQRQSHQPGAIKRCKCAQPVQSFTINDQSDH
jgi:hypothetical protein